MQLHGHRRATDFYFPVQLVQRRNVCHRQPLERVRGVQPQIGDYQPLASGSQRQVDSVQQWFRVRRLA